MKRFDYRKRWIVWYTWRILSGQFEMMIHFSEFEPLWNTERRDVSNRYDGSCERWEANGGEILAVWSGVMKKSEPFDELTEAI